MKNQGYVFICLLFFGLLLSCEKGNILNENDNQKDNVLQAEEFAILSVAEDEVLNLKSTSSIDDEVHFLRFGGKMNITCNLFYGNLFPNCATVTESEGGYPKEIIIDYGDGCSGRFGMGRTGIVIINISDTLINPGAVLTVTFQDVFVGNKEIDRISTLVNEGQNAEDHWVFSYQSETIMTYPDSIVSTRVISGEQEWISGFETPEVADDIYYITGEGTISLSDEVVFSRVILEPLLVDRSCGYIVSGIIEITRNDQTITIDFGDGECDSIAIVEKDGETWEIDLSTCHYKHEKNNEQHKNGNGKGK
ncbi:MAG: hypothetical protein JXJ22_07615 [Bacteroidales bacterium]|nr:hypothetical protein [Bacteroidales bacterium]